MAEKMTRRTFMKSAAAAAAAISLSGVLTGCGGSGQLADDEVQIGPFTVKVFGLDVDLGTESGTDKGAITGKVRLRYDAGGGSWQGGQYGDMFQASVGEAKLKQVSPVGTFFVSDTLLGKPFATEEKDLRLNFPDAEIKEAYLEWSACGAENRHQRHQRDAVPCQEEWRLCSHQDPAFPYHGLTRRPFCPEHSSKECPGLFVVLPSGGKWHFRQYFPVCKD